MIEQLQDDIVVIADNPQEMVEAQHATIGVIGAKLDGARKELADVSLNGYEIQVSKGGAFDWSEVHPAVERAWLNYVGGSDAK